MLLGTLNYLPLVIDPTGSAGAIDVNLQGGTQWTTVLVALVTALTSVFSVLAKGRIDRKNSEVTQSEARRAAQLEVLLRERRACMNVAPEFSRCIGYLTSALSANPVIWPTGGNPLPRDAFLINRDVLIDELPLEVWLDVELAADAIELLSMYERRDISLSDPTAQLVKTLEQVRTANQRLTSQAAILETHRLQLWGVDMDALIRMDQNAEHSALVGDESAES